MIRSEIIECFILGFALEIQDGGLGRPTQLAPLREALQARCGDCELDELLDALYVLSDQHAELYKFVGPGLKSDFRRVKNASRWRAFFNGQFRVKVLPEGRVRFQTLEEKLRQELAAAETQPKPRLPIGFQT